MTKFRIIQTAAEMTAKTLTKKADEESKATNHAMAAHLYAVSLGFESFAKALSAGSEWTDDDN
jgi:hypothetical protein